MEGVSLRPLIEGREPLRQYAFSIQGRYRSVDDGRYHLILDGKDRSVSLFDVTADPLEQDNIFRMSHPEAVTLRAALNDWLDRVGELANFDDALAAAMAKEEELRALGYLE